ncbi:MAG: HD domain-containing phosphohydrolase [Thermoanaerobaculaceae bacterium]
MKAWRGFPRWLRGGVAFLSLLTGWALLNRLSSVFEFIPGVTFFYPPAAATVMGAAALGPWAALAVWLGNFLSPWGAAQGPLYAALFGLPEVAFCLLTVAALQRAEARTRGQLAHVVVFGIGLGSLVSAAFGSLLLVMAAPPGFGGPTEKVLLGFFAWWFSDLAAAVTLGLTGVVLVRPQAVLTFEEQTFYKRWWQQRNFPQVLFGAVLVAGAMFTLVRVTGAKPHWFALFFAPVLAMAAFRGGTGAALVTNGWVSGLYLGLVVSFYSSRVQAVTVELASVYGQLLLFTMMAWLLGWQSAVNRTLIRQVEQQSRDLEVTLDEVAKLLARSVEAKETGNQGHSQRVATLARMVGEAMGLSPEELKTLRLAALLHDIGKMRVSETLLNQAVELEPGNKRQLRKELRQNLESLKHVELLRPILAVVEATRERYDGQGSGEFVTLQGLAGEKIPLLSRIIAPVCAYDVMTHPKPWRAAFTREEAVAELWRCSGRQFDPNVVQALTGILREGWDVEAERSAG